MTSPPRVRDLIFQRSEPCNRINRVPTIVALGSRFGIIFREVQAMEMQETKWRIAAAICVAIIYVFITTLSGGA